MKNTITALIMTLFAIPVAVMGQGDIHREEVKVIKSYNPMVDDANKINLNPAVTDTGLTTKEVLRYEISPVKLETDIEVAPIKAAKMSGMPQEQLYRFFMKTGFGNYTTPYFEVFYNSLRSRQHSYGIHYKHLSSLGNIKDYAYQGYSENGVDANASLFGDEHIYDFRGSYGRDVVHYYGRPDTLVNDTMSRDSIRQRFHTASFSASLRSNYRGSSRLNHAFGLSWQMINDLYPTTEHGAGLTGNLNKEVEWFKFSPFQVAGVNLSGAFYHATAGEDTVLWPAQTYLVTVNPFMSTRVKEMELKAGLTAAYESDNNGKLRVFPDILLKISLKEQQFLITGGLDGGIEHISFRTLATENPFVVSNPLLLNKTTTLRAFGGINTAIGPRVNFNALVSSESVKNMPMFTADTTFPFRNRFAVVYDDGTILTLKAELGVKVAEKLMITGLVKFQDYNMVTTGYAWHKPALTTGLDARYNLQDKIIAYVSMQYLSGIRVQEFENGVEKTETLKDLFDISLGAEYRYSKLLSGFIRLNNLSASKYYRWQYYPAQRFNGMLGITYAL
ncbi:MAG TPA: hypothetical protein P5228_08890 [Bacteroidales bacterium]|nr:hypothetical protein [Bacteroidales bacterium]HRZ48350.1 hypothetical protein [Bacteroidales bacterium]